MNKATILSCLGVVGLAVTSVLTAKATPKAVYLLEKAKDEKGDELTFLERVKVAGPVYIPSIVTGLSTAVCIMGSNVLNKRQQAAITSAYALLDSSYREYKSKVNDIYGEDADQQVTTAMAKDSYEEEFEESLPEGTRLFFDSFTCQYFEARMEDVLQKVVMDDGLECYILTPPFDPPLNYI